MDKSAPQSLASGRIPSAILFDLDGTLIDTAPDFARSLNLQRQRYDLPPLPMPQIRSVVSEGSRALAQLGFDLSADHPDLPMRIEELLDLYEANVAVDSRLFKGMTPLLHWLDRQLIPWGIVTNKPRRFTYPLLDALGLNVKSVVCPDDVSQRKPDPESLFLACQQLGANSDQAIYIGDHARDIEAGRRAGMTTIGARYGYLAYPGEAEQWRADHLIDSAADLLQWLQERL